MRQDVAVWAYRMMERPRRRSSYAAYCEAITAIRFPATDAAHFARGWWWQMHGWNPDQT